MLNLIIKNKFNIIGRGKVFSLSLKENKIHYSDLSIGKKAIIDNKEYEIKGIEYSVGAIGILDNIGILIK